MSTLVERIADLKETIEESKSGRDRLEGERDAALKQLKALGCETVDSSAQLLHT